LKTRVREYTPSHTAKLTGFKEARRSFKAATWFAGLGTMARRTRGTARKPTLSLYCQGLNQSSSGTAKNAALINLHLACRQIGQSPARGRSH
jgi:assimilatory nitrate reductase catalytic subunit